MSAMLAGVLAVLSFGGVAAASSSGFAVIFDCGSTGTRVHVYHWGKNGSDSIPTVRTEKDWNLKVTPGISSYDRRPAEAGASLGPLLALAQRVVPAADQASAIVLLRATAGMRLLPRRARNRIYDALHAAVREHSPFRPRREDFGTLDGSDEGVFGWLSVNILLKEAGRLDGSALGSLVALDLGGGSTQITLPTDSSAPAARAPASATSAASAPADADHVVVQLPGRPRSVYSHSHLGFGNKQALDKLETAEAAACLSRGAKANGSWALATAAAADAQLTGTGRYEQCEAAVRRVLAGFERAAQPAIGRRRALAMSLFFYAVNFAQVAGYLKPKAPGQPSPAAGASAVFSPRELRDAARSLCEEPHADLLGRTSGKDPLTADGAVAWRCFDLLYAAWLLQDGYGFEADAPVEFLGEVGGTEVEWTLGALYAKLAAGGSSGKARLRSSSAADRWGALLLLAGSAAVLLELRRRFSRPSSPAPFSRTGQWPAGISSWQV